MTGIASVVVALLLLVQFRAAPQAGGALLDRPIHFNAQGQLPADDSLELPVPQGAVTVRWYTVRGWYAAMLDGLEPSAAEQLCLGTSIRSGASGRFEHIASSTADARDPSACTDSRGAGAEVLGAFDTGQFGGRVCGDRLSYITQIPADQAGTLVLWVATFASGNTGIGVSSQYEVAPGRLPEIALSSVDCGPLPEQHVAATPVVISTPAAASAGRVPAARRKPAPAPSRAARCFSTEPGALQDVDATSAAPYLLHVPADAEGAPVVMFLPGGNGTPGSAQSVWNRFFASRPETDRLVVVVPYVRDGDLITDTSRMTAIVNEVLSCTGANAQEVHLAGTSNGGLAAFSVMSAHPEYFATLLGAPGAFPVPDPSKVKREVWTSRLAGRAVFNGVGALDGAWRDEVMATHNALAAAGVESVFVEFPGQGHVTNAAFDARVFFEFWSRH